MTGHLDLMGSIGSNPQNIMNKSASRVETGKALGYEYCRGKARRWRKDKSEIAEELAIEKRCCRSL